MAGFPISDDLRIALNAAYELRKAKDDWTYQTVADLAKCSRTTVYHVVSLTTHRAAKGSVELPRICEALGVDLVAFLPLDDEQRELLRILALARREKSAADFMDVVHTQEKIIKRKALGPTDPDK